jgi:hypothetical protein
MMTRFSEIRFHESPEVLEITFFSKDSRETVVAYVRESTVVLQREEDGKPLQAAVFGDRCFAVLREWLNNPMPEGEKEDARLRWAYEGREG